MHIAMMPSRAPRARGRRHGAGQWALWRAAAKSFRRIEQGARRDYHTPMEARQGREGESFPVHARTGAVQYVPKCRAGYALDLQLCYPS